MIYVKKKLALASSFFKEDWGCCAGEEKKKTTNRVKIQSNYSRKTISKLNLDYATVFSLAPYMNENVVTIVGICLLIGAMAKSSQVGRMKALKKPR
jgi:hypothetical protein